MKYSTCSVYVFFINIHILQHNEVTERIKSLSVPNFLQSTVVGQMIIMDINLLWMCVVMLSFCSKVNWTCI